MRPMARLLFAIMISLVLADPDAYAGPFPEGEALDGTKYKTAYSCEGDTLSISCDDTSAIINVIRANFGRFSIAICNPHGFTDWSVNCMAQRTIRVLQDRCDGKNACEMPVNSQIFGDPCPGTQKYVEVHFACKPHEATTKRPPLPPWFLEANAGNLWNPKTSSMASDVTEEEDDIEVELDQQPDPNPFSGRRRRPEKKNLRRPILVTQPTTTTEVRIPITTPRPTTTTTTTTTTTSTTHRAIKIVENDTSSPLSGMPTEIMVETPKRFREEFEKGSTTMFNDYIDEKEEEEEETSADFDYDQSNVVFHQQPMRGFCQPTYIRNIRWNFTREGERAIVPCPYGSTGLARWTCLSNPSSPFFPDWSGVTPDLSDCKSNSMTNLEVKVREEEQETVIVSALAKLTGRNGQELFGGDLESATAIMKTIANRIQYLMQTQSHSFYRKEAFIQEVFQNILRSSSNLLSRGRRPTWMDVPKHDRMKLATSLLLSLEENAFVVADIVKEQETVEESSSDIAMSLSVMNTRATEQISDSATITFPNSRRNPIQDSRSYHRSRFYHPAVDSISVPVGALRANANPSGVARVVFFAFRSLHEILERAELRLSKDNSNDLADDYILNSRIVSASLAKGRHIQLSGLPVVIELAHLRLTNSSGQATDEAVKCVFWDLEISAWSDDGCRVRETQDDRTTCECDHLTHFALVSRKSGPNPSSTAGLTGWTTITLQIVTYIAAVVILVTLAFLIVKFRSRIVRLLQKIGCMSEEKKAGIEKGCPKSQSFYTGVNLVAPRHGTGSMKDNRTDRNKAQARLSNYLLSDFQRQMSGMDLVANNPNGTLKLIDSSRNVYAVNSAAAPIYNVLEPAPSERLRDSVYMTPQLQHLTNTLRSKKKCQAGHVTGSPCPGQQEHQFSSCQQESASSSTNEVVFRAVSPHGHVYWEIDPTLVSKQHQSNEPRSRPDGAASNTNPNQVDEVGGSSSHSSSDMSSRQSSSRYSDNHPLITAQSPTNNHHILVNPFADVQLLSSVSSSPLQAPYNFQMGKPDDVRFSSLRFGGNHASKQIRNQLASHFGTRSGSRFSNKASKASEVNNVPEQVQRQVQIKDLKSISAQVKSNDYILAKIQSHISRGSPVDLIKNQNKDNGGAGPMERQV